jgi:hypothetical protein
MKRCNFPMTILAGFAMVAMTLIQAQSAEIVQDMHTISAGIN